MSDQLEFVVTDHTDNSGLTVRNVTDKEKAFFKEHGVMSSCNSFYVRTVSPEYDQAFNEMLEVLKTAQNVGEIRFKSCVFSAQVADQISAAISKAEKVKL